MMPFCTDENQVQSSKFIRNIRSNNYINLDKILAQIETLILVNWTTSKHISKCETVPLEMKHYVSTSQNQLIPKHHYILHATRTRNHHISPSKFKSQLK
jgi:hypothetical protein